MLPRRNEIATILVCEDHTPTRELLCSRLQMDRYRTIEAGNAADALRCSAYDKPDLILLDISLPDANGIDVLRAIRTGSDDRLRHDPEVPVLVLSGHGAEEERVRGLNEGADDYLVKPYAYSELLARIQNAMRHRSRQNGDLLRADEIVIDRVRHTVTVSGRPCSLSRKEFALLVVLAGEPERVFTKRELLDRVWSYDAGDRTRTLDAHASRLRRKLDPDSGRFVVNVWSVGYKLIDR